MAADEFTKQAAKDWSMQSGTPGVEDLPECSLADVHQVFGTWLGPRYDLQALDIVLAVAAAGLHLDGDPCWLQVIGGSGVGKTETLSCLSAAGCIVVSSIASEGALLSGAPRRKDSTGGLLRQVGARGVIVFKDFTTVLSMHREDRGKVLAALREIHDGLWVRTLGMDGGRTLDWSGRCVLISGVTGVYDEHHGVIAAMGDRFVLLRLDSEDPEVRRHATIAAIRNAGGEAAMREELGRAVGGFLIHLSPAYAQPGDHLVGEIFDLSDLVTRARSQVARDFKGEPEWAHGAEMPTRVAKQLLAAWRGAVMIGLDETAALLVVRRLAHDTLPPGRRAVLLDVADNKGTTTTEAASRVGMARASVDRVLRELALLRLVVATTDSEQVVMGEGMPVATVTAKGWRWHVSETVPVDLAVLRDGFGHSSTKPEGGTGVASPETSVPLNAD